MECPPKKGAVVERWTLVEVRLFEFFWQFLSLFCNMHWLFPGTRTRFFLTMATLFLCHSPASLDPTSKSLNLKCGQENSLPWWLRLCCLYETCSPYDPSLSVAVEYLDLASANLAARPPSRWSPIYTMQNDRDWGFLRGDLGSLV